MSQKIYGDLEVKRVVKADRRVNEGLSKETLVAQRALTAVDYAWIQVINASTQDVVLPDATTLTNGWSVVVMADSTSAASVNVKTYHATTPVLLKNIIVGRAYRFTLLDGTSSAGSWHIDFLEEADKLPAERYVDSFNATTDWTGPVGGYYTRTISAATHEMTTTPNIAVNLGPAPFVRVLPDQITVESTGDITIQVPSSPDLRFAGQVIVS